MNKQERIRKIKRKFLLNCLRRTLGYAAFLLFAICVGFSLVANGLLDKEFLNFYLIVSTWIIWLGSFRDNTDLYDIMSKDIEVVETTHKEGKDNNEK
jgi:hypothetical protein